VKQRKVIRVSPTGQMTFLADPALMALASKGEAKIRRASHVEPTHTILRLTFHVLRWLCGEGGKIAAWTRRWNVAWRVNLAPSAGPVLGPFCDRPAAINAEVAWLQSNNFGTPT